jgi:hypothetical protein
MAILVLIVLKKAEMGTRVPHICSLCFSKTGRQAFSQSVRNILSTCTFDKFCMNITNQVTEMVYLDIDMSRSITIRWVFAHHNA